MPQMAPLSWFLLFMIFSGTLILFSLMNYYIYLTSPTKGLQAQFKPINSLVWKW